MSLQATERIGQGSVVLVEHPFASVLLMTYIAEGFILGVKCAATAKNEHEKVSCRYSKLCIFPAA